MTSDDLRQMFSRPERDDDVMSHWENVMQGNECCSDALRRLVDDSWQRCLEARVDPGRDQAPPPLTENSLYTLRQKHGDLIAAGSPVMAMARDFLAETGNIMVLTDANGTILSLEGDSRTREEAERMNMVAGASWSERACGTNAIGTALAVAHPVQIHSAEHYCAGIQRWTCSSTVIVDPYDSSVLGAIDVSGLQHTYNRQHLALVVTTASKIENRLACQEMEIRFRLLERCMDRLLRGGDGVVVFDRRGRPVKANGSAEQALRALVGMRIGGPRLELSDLSLWGDSADGLPPSLKEWIRSDWLEPVIEAGERIGTVLTLPMPRRAGALSPVPDIGKRPQYLGTGDAFERVVGNDPTLREAVERARQLARSNVPVLLLGETGVGKEVFARGIHECGSQPDAPFVALNCGGLSRELLAAELFGYADGAFTGARRGGMVGKLEAADGGTLFLDELGEMPLDLQPHLLRALEGGEVYRLGENTPRKVRFRLIAATNRDLRCEIAEGRFRMDLFYRVAVTSIRIPALRDRCGDVEVLAGHLLQRLAASHGCTAPMLGAAALHRMNAYSWPGNVRELRNVLEGMLLLSPEARTLDERALPSEFFGGTGPVAQAVAVERNSGKLMEAAEQEAIVSAIDACRGNMAAAARSLGIAKSTLYLKIRKFGLDGEMDKARGSQSRPSEAEVPAPRL